MVVDNKGRVTYVRVLKEDLSIIRVSTLDGQPIPDFKAGQFVTLGSYIPNEKKVIRRAYSIASPPHQKKYFELLIRWVRKPLPGRLTTEVFNKKENDEVIWVKPVGVFTINEKCMMALRITEGWFLWEGVQVWRPLSRILCT